MSTIEIRIADITDLSTEVIVNAANEDLAEGGGVCGAIFQAAGRKKLREACEKIGHCDTGSAVITPEFGLKAKYIIHAVGPRWHGKVQDEELLYSAYSRSLKLAAENGCRSVGFPLISAGIYGCPVDTAWMVALTACMNYLDRNSETSIEIIFAVLDKKIRDAGYRAAEDSGHPHLMRYLQKAKTSYHSSGGRKTPIKPEKTGEASDTLMISGLKKEAVFFHKPEEPYGYLSNWYPASFELDGMRFNCSEQYIMYKKCLAFGDLKSAKAVMETTDPAEQQAIGRKASGYVEKAWAGMRQLVCLRALKAKFRQNSELQEELLATGDAFLVECAVSDKAWACGISLYDDSHHDPMYWSGSNLLGFALMEVRDMLRRER